MGVPTPQCLKTQPSRTVLHLFEKFTPLNETPGTGTALPHLTVEAQSQARPAAPGTAGLA